MSAIEIAERNAKRAREEALERQRIIETYHPDIAALVRDIAEHCPGAKLGMIKSPYINWERKT